jgi:hypothetical protein
MSTTALSKKPIARHSQSFDTQHSSTTLSKKPTALDTQKQRERERRQERAANTGSTSSKPRSRSMLRTSNREVVKSLFCKDDQGGERERERESSSRSKQVAGIRQKPTYPHHLHHPPTYPPTPTYSLSSQESIFMTQGFIEQAGRQQAKTLLTRVCMYNTRIH